MDLESLPVSGTHFVRVVAIRPALPVNRLGHTRTVRKLLLKFAEVRAHPVDVVVEAIGFANLEPRLFGECPDARRHLLEQSNPFLDTGLRQPGLAEQEECLRRVGVVRVVSHKLLELRDTLVQLTQCMPCKGNPVACIDGMATVREFFEVIFERNDTGLVFAAERPRVADPVGGLVGYVVVGVSLDQLAKDRVGPGTILLECPRA